MAFNPRIVGCKPKNRVLLKFLAIKKLWVYQIIKAKDFGLELKNSLLYT
jgi:hypothetical protein